MLCPENNTNEFFGSEFDWLAIDTTGHVAYFSTAGFGWIPQSVLKDPTPFVDYTVLEAQAIALPRATTACYIHPKYTEHQDFINIGCNGIYFYSWDYSRTYTLLVSPAAPVHYQTVGEFGLLAARTQLPITFGKDIVAKNEKDLSFPATSSHETK